MSGDGSPPPRARRGGRPAAPPPRGGPPPPPPPPGWTAPPPYPQPGYAPPGYAPGYPLAMPAAHKPGAIPLRPLGLGDIYDAAFKIIRFNPRATVGSAVLVTAVAMMIPVLVTGIMTLLLDVSGNVTLDGTGSTTTTGDATAADITEFIASYGSLIVGSILQSFGLIFVTGMVAHVTMAAAIGRRLSLGEAWAATKGKRWSLVGLAFLLGTAATVGVAIMAGVIVVLILLAPTWLAVLGSIALVLATIVALVFFWVRLAYLAVPPLMLEQVGVFGAIGRAWTLSARQFWRTFGIALLTAVITQIAGSIIGVPFSIVGLIGTVATDNVELQLMAMVVTNALSAVVASAFVAPFTSSVASLQYVDQRIRKEGFDVELMTRAGIVGP